MTKVNRGQLLQVLELVSPGLSTRNDMIEQSNYFCFQDKKVFTYDDEVACIMPSPIDITGAVPSDPLKGILNKLKEDHLDVSQSNGELILKGRGQRTGIRFDAKIELPIENLETPNKWKDLPDRFSEAIKLVENCAGKDESQFELTCVHFHPKYIEAYDTYQFARFKLALDIKSEMLFRQISIKHLIDMEMKQFSETKQWLHFRNDTGLVMSCRRYSDSYPVLDELAKVSGNKIQLPKGLADVADRAEIFSMENNENNVQVDLKPGWVSVKGEGNHGWHRGRKKIKYSGQTLSFMVHPKMLAQLVKQHSECELCTKNQMALKAELGDLVFVTSLANPEEKKAKKKPEKNIVKKKVSKKEK